ncbi:class I SAM-dependent methyltransferase [Marinifilum sp. JC120]|nr:class I SAM-dependent methyltransferase [Marinifilum sp. JC120]
MSKKDYSVIQNHYEKCLKEHGPNHLGVDWPNAKDLATRFNVMLDVIRKDTIAPCSLLDLGCGVGLLAEHLIIAEMLGSVNYRGVDISQPMIDQARKNYASLNFEAHDILESPLEKESVDYIVMNGVLTEKLTLSYEEMEFFAQRIIQAAFEASRIGVAFNVMNHHVDWQRDSLFHWRLDDCVGYIIKNLTRHVVVRMDYGLYEYTVYLYKEPNV